MTAYSHFAVAVAARASATGLLACSAAYLMMTTRLYASALILILLAVAITVELAHKVARIDQSVASALEAVVFGGAQLPAKQGQVFARCLGLLEKSATTLGTARFEQQQRVAYLQALLETAPAALLVVQGAGLVTAQNNSARQLLATIANDLKILTRWCADAAPGARQILQLADGRRLLASAAQFALPGGEPQLLLSLQRITGELDAVELLAWQDMARVLTHEMMNSLTPIASLSESLEMLVRRAQQADPVQLDELAMALEVIKRRSLGLTNFVERYRQVVELPQPKLEVIDAAAILAGIDQLMRVRFKELGIAYRSEVVPADLHFPADPQLLEQAIINLLSNASDAVVASSEPEIELRCELNEQRILLTVRDNGAGLPANTQEQIFVPFFTTKPGGSGIGLSLARQIAVAHGGTLDVQAVRPRGLLLSMSLPARQMTA